jgi:dihydrofolate synthase / folylpolyglutamate synthase
MENKEKPLQLDPPGLRYLNQLEVWKGAGGFGIDKIAGVMRELGNPQDAVKTVHVTGTNGKGSVSAMIASILGAEGYKVGLNISPHLVSLNERILVDGLPISDELIGEYALIVKKASENVGQILSFHEGITAIAFVAFRELKVNWAVIEVGLGGRYDASNIISSPEVSVITSIDLDHQHILGNTKPEIAYQKAGIIKKGRPVVVGALDSESFQVVNKVATSLSSSIYYQGRDFNYTSIHDAGLSEEQDSFRYTFQNKAPYTINKVLKGRHQFNNSAVALAVAEILNIREDAKKRGLEQVFWPGRLEVINWKGRIILIDCAHNPHGIATLVDNLKSWGIKSIDLAFGVLDTKDWKTMVDQLQTVAKSWSLLEPISDRALSAEAISEYLSGIGVSNRCYGAEISRFLNESELGLSPLLITGSIYLIGTVRKVLGIEPKSIW